MEYSPPPLFKQGASARAKVAFFALISLALLGADSRLHALTVIRQAVGTALYPLEMLALMPRDAAYGVADYFASLSSLEKENAQLKRQQILNGQTLQQAQHLLAENTQLRKLLGTSAQVPAKSLMGEILYDARDAFTRKIILNRGSKDGVEPGQPVIDDIGVVGQVTRVFPFTSEVTLLTDKDQAIPVQVVRSGLRSVAYGRGQSGVLDLRFMAANADIRKGDSLVTSGIDGIYPPGLAVATVVQIENKSNSDAFARIMCQPVAGINRHRQLLILLVDTHVAPPGSGDETPDPGSKPGGTAVENAQRDGAKESPSAASDAARPDKQSGAPAAPAKTEIPAVVQKKDVPSPATKDAKAAKEPEALPDAAPRKPAVETEKKEVSVPPPVRDGNVKKTAAPAAPSGAVPGKPAVAPAAATRKDASPVIKEMRDAKELLGFVAKDVPHVPPVVEKPGAAPAKKAVDGVTTHKEPAK